MLLPIPNAILALLTSLAIIRLLGHATTVPSVAPTLATMIGLGVGIDYALFIVTRHFRVIGDGLHYDESIARAAATSGGAVPFAGGHQRARDHLRGVHHGVRVRQLRAQRRSDHQEFGIGLAVAVILDATVVRCLLVPALMLLMGRVNWWMPGWLGRVVPHTSIEGAEFFRARDITRGAELAAETPAAAPPARR
jgi:uncharacterized membrane protein YdfJ with MMPL/SSD domain